jgi:hypothetical protein
VDFKIFRAVVGMTEVMPFQSYEKKKQVLRLPFASLSVAQDDKQFLSARSAAPFQNRAGLGSWSPIHFTMKL